MAIRLAVHTHATHNLLTASRIPEVSFDQILVVLTDIGRSTWCSLISLQLIDCDCWLLLVAQRLFAFEQGGAPDSSVDCDCWLLHLETLCLRTGRSSGCCLATLIVITGCCLFLKLRDSRLRTGRSSGFGGRTGLIGIAGCCLLIQTVDFLLQKRLRETTIIWGRLPAAEGYIPS